MGDIKAFADSPFETYLKTALIHEQPRDKDEKLRMKIAFLAGSLHGNKEAGEAYDRVLARFKEPL